MLQALFRQAGEAYSCIVSVLSKPCSAKQSGSPGTGVVQLATDKLEEEKAGFEIIGCLHTRTKMPIAHCFYIPLVSFGEIHHPQAAVPLRLGAALQAFARKDNNLLGVGEKRGINGEVG